MAYIDMRIKVGLSTFDLIRKFKGHGGKRAFNRAVKAGMESMEENVTRAIRRRAPRETGLLRRSVGVVVEGGAGGRANKVSMVPASFNREVDKYWLVREFGPRGGVIRGKPVMTFAARGTKFFGTSVKASDVHRNPTAYGFDYTMIQGDMIFGVTRKTGKTWAQLYPNGKGRRKAIRRGKGIPSKGNPNFIPLFVIVRAVEQNASPYLRPAFDSMTPRVHKAIEKFVMDHLN